MHCLYTGENLEFCQFLPKSIALRAASCLKFRIIFSDPNAWLWSFERLAIRTFTFTLINHANEANTLDLSLYPIALTYARIQRTGADSNALLKKNIALSPLSVQSSPPSPPPPSSPFLTPTHFVCVSQPQELRARLWIEPYYTRPMTMTSLAIL